MAITTIKVGNNFNAGTSFKVFQISSRADVANLPTDCGWGSLALPVDESYKFKLSNESVWTEVTAPVDLGDLTGTDGVAMDWGTI